MPVVNIHVHMADSDAIVHGKALEWGGSIGIRISRAEAVRLGIRVGQELDLKVLSPNHRLDLRHLPTFRDGTGADEHDSLLGEARSADLGRGPV